MAVLHYQFETIHPFYDGNGRTGRIVNILYLILKGYLDIPILYLSSYIEEAAIGAIRVAKLPDFLFSTRPQLWSMQGNKSD